MGILALTQGGPVRVRRKSVAGAVLIRNAGGAVPVVGPWLTSVSAAARHYHATRGGLDGLHFVEAQPT